MHGPYNLTYQRDINQSVVTIDLRLNGERHFLKVANFIDGLNIITDVVANDFVRIARKIRRKLEERSHGTKEHWLNSFVAWLENADKCMKDGITKESILEDFKIETPVCKRPTDDFTDQLLRFIRRELLDLKDKILTNEQEATEKSNKFTKEWMKCAKRAMPHMDHVDEYEKELAWKNKVHAKFSRPSAIRKRAPLLVALTDNTRSIIHSELQRIVQHNKRPRTAAKEGDKTASNSAPFAKRLKVK